MIYCRCRSAVIVNLYANDFLMCGKILRGEIMEFEIREAVISDAEAIYILNRDELGYDYPLEQTKKLSEFTVKQNR